MSRAKVNAWIGVSTYVVSTSRPSIYLGTYFMFGFFAEKRNRALGTGWGRKGWPFFMIAKEWPNIIFKLFI